MSTRKHGLGLLGLLAVAALGVMAFASSAMAVTPQFTVNGVPASAALDALFEGVQEGKGTYAIPGLNLEFNCEEGEFSGGLIGAPTDARVGKILYKGCTALNISTKTEISTCVFSDVHTGNPAKTHITALNELFLPVEFASGDFGVLAENISIFINFLSGKGCPLPLKNEFIGTVCYLIAPATNDTVEPLITTNPTIQKSCPTGDKLTYGAQEGFITRSVKLKLSGAHAGEKLGVLLF